MLAHTSSRRDFWLIVCASLSWGTVGVANQAIYAHVATNALSLAFFRLVIAAPLFLLASQLLPGRRLFRVKPRDLGVMVLMGIMQALYQACYSAAIAYAGVTVPTLVALCAAPVIVALFSAFITHERLNLLTLVALACALVGTFLLVEAHPCTSGGGVSLLGILFALLAGGGYAGFILCGRLLTSHYHPLHVNAVGCGALALFGSANWFDARISAMGLVAFALPGLYPDCAGLWSLSSGDAVAICDGGEHRDAV